MRRGALFFSCFLALISTAMEVRAQDTTARFRADAQASILTFQETNTDTQGGPGVRQSRAQVSAPLADASAASDLLQEEVSGDTRASSVGPLPNSLADGLSGLWDTLTVTDPTLPEGAPLEINVTVTMTGYLSFLVQGSGEARAGIRTVDDLPQGPLDETTYPLNEAADARVFSPSRSGYFQVSADAPVITIANGRPVALYLVLFTHSIGRGHLPAERIIARGGFAITAVSGNDLTVISAAHDGP